MARLNTMEETGKARDYIGSMFKLPLPRGIPEFEDELNMASFNYHEDWVTWFSVQWGLFP